MIYQLVTCNTTPICTDFGMADQYKWKLAGICLGDLILAAIFPLVMRKAFGRSAGILAMVLGFVTIGLLVVSVISGWLVGAFPVMVVLGPLMVIQYIYWHQRLEMERTTLQYLQTEPICQFNISSEIVYGWQKEVRTLFERTAYSSYRET